MLRFLGNGNGFANENTCAFFTKRDRFVLIDCPASAFNKLKLMDTELCYARKIMILLTHLHNDNISGLGSFVKYVHKNLKRQIEIVAPSTIMAKQVAYFLSDIEGCPTNSYKIICLEHDNIIVNEPWFTSAIQTTHANLKSGCYGYKFTIEDMPIIYTGDTNTLDPFKAYLEDGCELYVDAEYRKSPNHLSIIENLEYYRHLFDYKKIHTYLMHMDDITRIEDLIQITNVNIARIYDPEKNLERIMMRL